MIEEIRKYTSNHNTISGWEAIDKKIKNEYENISINLTIPIERKFMIAIISEELPYYTRLKITSAIDSSIKNLDFPTTNNYLLQYLKDYLRLSNF